MPKWDNSWGADRRKRKSQSASGKKTKPGVNSNRKGLGGDAGKGDTRRQGDDDKFRENYEKIFGGREEKLNIMSDEDREALIKEMRE